MEERKMMTLRKWYQIVCVVEEDTVDADDQMYVINSYAGEPEPQEFQTISQAQTTLEARCEDLGLDSKYFRVAELTQTWRILP
jgi:hypothetical protein